MRGFNLFPAISGAYHSEVVSFDELIAKIRTPNPHVEQARRFSKGSPEYDQVKISQIPAFFANSFTTENTRSPAVNKFKASTGYIYGDIDGFESKSQALQFRGSLTEKNPCIAACWLSLSEKGLSFLVKVKGCNADSFKLYWDQLNEAFDGHLDTQTRDYYRLCCISYDPTVYVNPGAVEFEIPTHKKLLFRTSIPVVEFKGAKYKVFPEGLDVFEINLFRYTSGFKNEVWVDRSIKNGSRHHILGYISLVLVHLNPQVPKHVLAKVLFSISNKYCETPKPEKEVRALFESNYKKYMLGQVDMSQYVSRRQYVFLNTSEFHFTPSERMRIIVRETNKLRGTSADDTKQRIHDAVLELMDGSKITALRVSQHLDLSLVTVKRYYSQFRTSLIKDYNNGLKGEKVSQVLIFPTVVG